MSDEHWAEFGLALKKIHAVEMPPEIIGRIRHETYSSEGRQTVKMFLERVEIDEFDDPVASETAVFMKSKRTEIVGLIDRAEQRAQILQANPPDFIVCHSDLHAGNILIGTDNAFYIVDWDEPILAPKERDLMYIGSGLLASKRTPKEEETLFYSSYGQVPINLTALAYYRYERIIQDIFEICKQLLLTNEGGADREISLGNLKSNFLPNHTIDIAYQSDKGQI
jgi:spectinomycin phosphotransferase